MMHGSQHWDRMLMADTVIEHNGHPGPGLVAPRRTVRLGLLHGFQLQCAESELDLPLS